MESFLASGGLCSFVGSAEYDIGGGRTRRKRDDIRMSVNVPMASVRR